MKSVESGSWSGAYGEREAAPAVRFTSNIELPTEFVTLLMPSRPPQDSDAAHGKLTRVNSDGNTSAYQFIEGNDQHYFVFAQAKGITFHEFASDADFMYCSYRDERLSLLVFCNCTTIKFCDTTIVATPDRLSWIEISQSASAVNLSSSDSILQVPEALLSGLFEAREMSTAPLNAGHL